MNKIQALAAEMNVTESDLVGFLSCVRAWMDKGYSFEQAVQKHQQQMTRIAEKAHEMPREIVVEAFFPN